MKMHWNEGGRHFANDFHSALRLWKLWNCFASVSFLCLCIASCRVGVIVWKTEIVNEFPNVTINGLVLFTLCSNLITWLVIGVFFFVWRVKALWFVCFAWCWFKTFVRFGNCCSSLEQLDCHSTSFKGHFWDRWQRIFGFP